MEPREYLGAYFPGSDAAKEAGARIEEVRSDSICSWILACD